MNREPPRIVAAAALVIGALLGMAGSFPPSAELRAIAWGLDGIALVVGSALLAVHHLRPRAMTRSTRVAPWIGEPR